MTHRGTAAAADAASAGRPASGPASTEPPAWAPLRQPAFGWLWLGVLLSSVGTVMQTVGAQWLLVDASQRGRSGFSRAGGQHAKGQTQRPGLQPRGEVGPASDATDISAQIGHGRGQAAATGAARPCRR